MPRTDSTTSTSTTSITIPKEATQVLSSVQSTQSSSTSQTTNSPNSQPAAHFVQPPRIFVLADSLLYDNYKSRPFGTSESSLPVCVCGPNLPDTFNGQTVTLKSARELQTRYAGTTITSAPTFERLLRNEVTFGELRDRFPKELQLTTQIEFLEGHLEKISNQFHALTVLREQTNQENTRLHAEVDNLTQHKQQRVEALNQLQLEVKKLQNASQDSIKNNTQLQEELQVKSQTLVQTLNTVTELNEQLLASQQQLQLGKQTSEELQVKNTSLQKDIDSVTVELTELKASFQVVEAENTGAFATVATVTTQNFEYIERLNARADELTTLRQTLQTSQDALIAAEARIRDLSTQQTSTQTSQESRKRKFEEPYDPRLTSASPAFFNIRPVANAPNDQHLIQQIESNQQMLANLTRECTQLRDEINQRRQHEAHILSTNDDLISTNARQDAAFRSEQRHTQELERRYQDLQQHNQELQQRNQTLEYNQQQLRRDYERLRLEAAPYLNSLHSQQQNSANSRMTARR